MIDWGKIPAKWKWKPLGQICKIIGGKPAPQIDEAFHAEGIPFVRMKDLGAYHLTTELVNVTDRLSNEYLKKNNIELVKKGAILLPRSGSVALNHRAILGVDAVIVSHICALEVTSPDVFNVYLYYVLTRMSMQSITKKTTGLDAINFEDLSKINIPLPPLDEQRRIAAILDKADAIRQKRQESIRLTEEFLRSVFLDMFGDPVTNPKGWEKVHLSEIAERSPNAIKAGPFGSSLKKECYVKNGYKVYGQEQVIRDDFDYGDYYIDEYKYTELESCRIKAGDILISLVGTFGKISIVPDSFEPGIINPRLMKISLDFKRALPTFVKSALSSQSMVARIETLAHGGTMGIVNVGIMKNLKLPLPPIGLQRNFQEILSKYSEYVARQKTITFETNSLFGSLTQRAFRGEL